MSEAGRESHPDRIGDEEQYLGGRVLSGNLIKLAN
jgi:hypothetical protein